MRHYLFLDLADGATRRLRLFSDGSTGIVLNYSPTLLLGSQNLPSTFFYGQITGFKEIVCQGPVQLVIIVFHPQGANRLLHLPASELNDQVIPLDELFGSLASGFQDAVGLAGTVAGKVAQIESFLLSLARGSWPGDDRLVGAALDLIRMYRGTITIQELTGHIGCQARQLERRFNAVVGLTPKHFCNVVRTLHFVKSLQDVPLRSGLATASRCSLTASAYDSGFYDQAHGIREFRKMTGLTPSQYLKESDPLALNFLLL